ncbi:septum formation protein [Ekhidna lutea]|uniref:dTTP/UTP pyrophosphatase n=1 Tax=Ekhidna lutea TaxID=447679 RepID=A0A239GMM0_EKHLU|nr:Maf family nucleotide pyrophosphatase [Ekhidna lutea]SNS69304.1 septum formation protein [Ekhidna lutea]
MKHFNNLILASNSPRRKQLLEEIGLQFEVKTIPFEETFPEDLASDKVAEYLAIEKNKAHREAFGDDSTIITADTVVIFTDKILGKPKSKEEAKKILQILSGKIHQVMSGVCISKGEKQVSFSNLTEVMFRELTEGEIDYFIEAEPPLDKAGSYGIQDWIGKIGVEWIKGSFYNVVGLPVDQVYTVLKEDF